MKFFRFTFLLCSLTTLGAINAEAQRYIKDCAHAKTIADTMACVKKRADAAQSELNDLYKKALESQQEQLDEDRVSLGETQQGWFAYRDAQCAWEAEQAETGHEKIYELSCIAALTEDRITVLKAMSEMKDSVKPREFSSHPRWMNALADDYPDVLWRYNQWIQSDIDCDAEEEEVMTGITMKYDANGKPFYREQDGEIVADEFYGGPLYKAEAVIAVSDNSRTGLSKTTLFRLPVGNGKSKDGLYFCDMPQSLEAIEQSVPEEQDSENTDENKNQDAESAACTARLKISDGDCHPAYIYWDGKQFRMEKKQKDQAQEKSTD